MNEWRSGVRALCETDKKGRGAIAERLRVHRGATNSSQTPRSWGKGVWGMSRLILRITREIMSSGETQVSAGMRQRTMY